MQLDLLTQLWGKSTTALDVEAWLTVPRYATGWNYFLKYAIVLPNNLTAAGIIIQYWRPDLNVAIFVTTFTVAIIAVNVSRTFSWDFVCRPILITRRFFTYHSSARQSSGCPQSNY